MIKNRKFYWWYAVFPSDLGWMLLLGGNKTIRKLSFGHSSARDAKRAFTSALLAKACAVPWQKIPLAKRLQAYAKGANDDFRDISVDLAPSSDFQKRVLTSCRKIPYGATLSYGRLAAMAGSPRAARAVGNSLASNRIPLIIPCHRVVCADGHIGFYSAPGGRRMKKRLLGLEKGPVK
ncbi:MAG: methylated-DNA--[protein]-cysteine S-methyltransferase [Thermoguttaceae bacterium]